MNDVTPGTQPVLAYVSVFLCEDCAHAAHGSDIEPPTDSTPLSKFGDKADLTADYCSDHYVLDGNYCTNCDNAYGDGDDGHHEFSTADCAGCETKLAGGRYRFALWN